MTHTVSHMAAWAIVPLIMLGNSFGQDADALEISPHELREILYGDLPLDRDLVDKYKALADHGGKYFPQLAQIVRRGESMSGCCRALSILATSPGDKDLARSATRDVIHKCLAVDKPGRHEDAILMCAVSALSQIGDSSDIELIWRVLRESKNIKINLPGYWHSVMYTALGELGDASTAEELIKHMRTRCEGKSLEKVREDESVEAAFKAVARIRYREFIDAATPERRK